MKFKPGHAKRGGRRAGTPNKATVDGRGAALRYADMALDTLATIAEGGTSEAARVSAASAILDRAYGRPQQAIEHSGTIDTGFAARLVAARQRAGRAPAQESTTLADTPKPKRTKTGGRKKGTPNKLTADLKEMILEALNQAGGRAGGVAYLVQQAKANPSAFLTLVGKVLPLQVNAKHDGQLNIYRVDYSNAVGVYTGVPRASDAPAETKPH